MTASLEVDLRVPWRAAPIRLAGGPDERTLLEGIAAHGGAYERGVMRLLARLVPPDAVVLDAGAHIGVMAMTLATLAPRGVVHAMEASPATAAWLAENVAVNGFGNIRVHHAAIAATPGTVRINPTAGFSAGAHVGADGQVEIRAVSLDAWAAEQGLDRLDLVKVDIEGSEPALLEGGAATIERFRPAMVVEVNPVALRRCGRTQRELWRALTRHHRHVCWIGRGGALVPLTTERELARLLRRDGVGDVLCTATRPPRVRTARAVAGRLLAALPHRGPELAIEPTLRLRASGPIPARMAPGARALVPVELTNLTRSRLMSSGRYPTAVAARIRGVQGRVVVDGRRGTITGTLRPGQSARVAVEIAAPAPGEYEVVVAVVQDGYAWLDDLGPEAAVRFPLAVTDDVSSGA